MLVYEKWDTETVNDEEVKVRHLYGTLDNIPSNSDNQLVYQDADGDSVTPSLENRYIDDGNGGIKMVDSEGNETFLAVNIKKSDNSLINIVPGGDYEPEDKVLDSIAFTRKPTKTEYIVGDTLDSKGCIVKATFTSGEVETVTSDCDFIFDDSESTTATIDDTAIIASYTYPETGESQVTKTASYAITVESAPANSNEQ